MYYYIKGKLTRLNGDYAVIEAYGVGYKLFITHNTRAKLASFFEKEILLYTYLNVREDAKELYGFDTEEEQGCFVKLISVSGVGPKAAVSILSVFSPEKLAFAVSTGDAKAISKANGVGLKTAQKVIIELKGKLDLEEGGEDSPAGGITDAVNALTVLGYTKAEAMTALKGIDPSMPLEEIITAAFKKLNRF
ncbi:MAG: Holliday junction branch migration protein RuvA [Eubacteriales bacterium]|nr:Holliday junction branch migration protein RuvA [Eubacteriales bacterium]